MQTIKSILRYSMLLSMAVVMQPAISIAQATETAAVKTTATANDVAPPAIQTLRRHMLDGNVNTLTFHSMDQLFSTRPVARSGTVWELPKDEKTLNFTYTHKGVSRPAEEALERTHTNALLIIKDGKIVYERYRNLTNETTRYMSWSMAKSITSLLIGVAINEGHIKSTSDPVTKYLPELKDSGYAGVSIKDVLEMRSGVDWDERYDFGENPSPAAKIFEDALVAGRLRYADAARPLGQAHKPGSTFNYSTVDTAVLGWLLERATKRPVADYMAEKLWGPLGVDADGYWIADGPPGVGREFTGAGFNARLRDYGRLGLMVVSNGRANGTQIIPEKWIALSTKTYNGPGKEPEGPLNYAYQWWAIKGTQSFSAIGLQGQFIYIDPPSKTVIVKLSHFPPGANDLSEETGEFFKAAVAWNPK